MPQPPWQVLIKEDVLWIKTTLFVNLYTKYSKIPILRPPLRLPKSGLKDHFWTVPRVVSNQMYTGVENEEKNSLNFQNKVFNR